MTTRPRLTILALACSVLMFGACDRDPAPASTPNAPTATQGAQTALGRTVEKALEQARKQLENENISLNGNDNGGGLHIGKHAIGNDDPNLPKAHITPQGDLVIADKPVTINADQRALLMQYRRDISGIAAVGMAIGAKGADLAGVAVKEVLSGLFSGKTDQIEQRMDAEGKKLEAEALKICDALGPLLATQQKLSASLPEFKPYASMTQQDIDDCRKDSSQKDGNATDAAQRDAVREDIRDGIRKTVQAAAQTAGVAAGSVAAAVGGSNVATVNGVRFLLPSGNVEVNTDNGNSVIRHGNGLRVRMDAKTLSINGENYPRPSANAEVDLREGGTVKIDGKTVTALK